MECTEGYEVSKAGACVPAPLFSFDKNDKNICTADDAKKEQSPFLPSCEIVAFCSPKLAANKCSTLTAENETSQCTISEKTDASGNKRIDETNCGQTQPYKITVVPKDGKAIEFRFDGKEYKADYLNAKGEKIGSVGYSEKEGYLYYVNDKTHVTTATLADGTVVTKKNLSKDAYEGNFTTKEGKVVYSVKADAHGRVTTSNYADGSVVVEKYNRDGDLQKETISYADGTTTTLAQGADGYFQGVHKDKHNHVIEDVIMVGNYPMHKVGSADGTESEYLLFRERKTGSERALALPADIKHDHTAHFQNLNYDGNMGSLSLTTKDGATVVESTQGRTDVLSGKGTMISTTITGEHAYAYPDGDSGAKRAVVIHPDGCGAQLNADSTIDRWCIAVEDKASSEKLSAKEGEFLKRHSDTVDSRDLTEIHRRLRGDESRLNQIYEKLAQIDDVKNLSQSEKTALTKTLMHHLAYPDEIVQGRSPTCNVAVLEIQMAKSFPEKYLSFVVDAISKDGTSAPYKTFGGKSVHFDENNLKMTDLSGRDLASRVFQTAALQVNYYPGSFKNTADGNGVFREHGKHAETFKGLPMKDIAELRYQLTGEETAICWITSQADLQKALELSKGRPIIVEVDANKVPFVKPEDVDKDKKSGAHVVLVTGIEAGPPAKVKVLNPWGPNAETVSSGSTMPADDFIKNVISETAGDVQYGTILMPGPRGQSGTVLTGKFEKLSTN